MLTQPHPFDAARANLLKAATEIDTRGLAKECFAARGDVKISFHDALVVNGVECKFCLVGTLRWVTQTRTPAVEMHLVAAIIDPTYVWPDRDNLLYEWSDTHTADEVADLLRHAAMVPHETSDPSEYAAGL